MLGGGLKGNVEHRSTSLHHSRRGCDGVRWVDHCWRSLCCPVGTLLAVLLVFRLLGSCAFPSISQSARYCQYPESVALQDLSALRHGANFSPSCHRREVPERRRRAWMHCVPTREPAR